MYDIVIGRIDSDKQKYGAEGTVFLGKHYVKMGRTTSLSNKILLDVIRSHVIFVCGKRGGGKSYTMGVIAEGIIGLPPKIRNNISVIMLDTMGVYWTMKYPNQQDRELLEKIAQAAGNLCADLVAKLRNPLMRRILPIVMRLPAQAVAEMLPHLEHIVAEIQRGRDPILYNAPLLILFHAEERPMSSVDTNASLALHNAALMAYSQGLGSVCIIALVNACARDRSVQQLVKLPENHKVYGALCIGYPMFEFKKWPERRAPKITWL